MTISAVCHFHAEANALPGFIQEAEKTFDHIILVSSAPDGVEPDEQTIEIAKASGHKLIFDTISQGFGKLRTRCISYGGGDVSFILDADERVFASVPRLTCTGTGKFPDTMTPDVHVTQHEMLDQRSLLRHQLSLIGPDEYALCVSRRHWFGPPGDFTRPCQNWNEHPDWQLRCLKNSQWICFDPYVKMHEKLIRLPDWVEPRFQRANLNTGAFIDHFSLHFKGLEPEQNTEDAKIYNDLVPGCVKDMWLDHFPKA